MKIYYANLNQKLAEVAARLAELNQGKVLPLSAYPVSPRSAPTTTAPPATQQAA